MLSSGTRCKITGLSKNAAYKAYVVAEVWSVGKYITLSKSRAAHFFTGNVRGGYTNPKSLKLRKKQFTLRTGRKAIIKGTVKKVRKDKKLREPQK